MTRPLILLGIAATALTSTTTWVHAQGGIAVRGAQLATQMCTQCHVTDLPAAGSDIAPSFRMIIGKRSPDYIRGFLANPHARAMMPPFELGPTEIEDIVAFMEGLGQGPRGAR